jgi:hypothetical protein
LPPHRYEIVSPADQRDAARKLDPAVGQWKNKRMGFR